MNIMNDLLTTRQIEEILKVDRITIYRMLGDGRLRGFKVGGQWRKSERRRCDRLADAGYRSMAAMAGLASNSTPSGVQRQMP